MISLFNKLYEKDIHYFSITFFFSLSSKAQWLRQNINTTASFRTVHALSDKNVWISGSKGTVLRTIDGGQNWQGN
jgi:photosystem II stability/assembly factor-like uncharacterized protein